MSNFVPPADLAKSLVGVGVKKANNSVRPNISLMLFHLIGYAHSGLKYNDFSPQSVKSSLTGAE